MSKEVDERVVSMQFDNAQFEANIKSTIKSLQELDKNLQMKNASAGLDTVATSMKKVDISPLSNGIETVKLKFSAMEVAAVTALSNITNQAVNAGKQMIKSLTVTPVSDGFKEYELKMNSVQTIMASTGEDIEVVNQYLDELNQYADKTIYSFSDMTSNIGKFTNAGVKLNDAVKAIQGISNEAAVSGANANEASRAMYNFAQALSAGYVKLIDWKSIENANMATVEFKNELIKTAVELGTLVESEGRYVSTTTDLNGNVSEAFTATSMFNDSLSAQWMTTDVLTKTLAKYADETTELGQKAFKCATQVKTFTQLMDTLKEAVGSGWAQTWELLFGNLEEAKDLWTSISDVVGGFINRISEARNNLLKGALGSKKSFFENLLGKIDKSEIGKAAKSIETVSSSVDKVTKSLSYYQDMVTAIWRGDYDNGQKRVELLTGEGHNYMVLQSLVNKGYEYKITMDDVTQAESKYGKVLNKVSETSTDITASLGELTDEQLKEIGLTDEEVKAYRDLEEQSKKTGVAMKDIIANMDDISGRSLLLNGLKNIGNSLITVFRSIGSAWREVFPATTSSQLYNVIAGFHKLSTYLVLNDDDARKIKETFQGLFSILHLISTLIGGPIKVAVKIVSKILEAMNLNIWDLTSAIGRALTKFSNWIESLIDFDGVAEKAVPWIKKCASAVKDFINKIKPIDKIKQFFEFITPYIKAAKDAIVKWFEAVKPFEKVGNLFKSAAVGVKEWINGLKEADNIPLYIIKGIIKGVQNGTSGVFKAFWNLGEIILNAVKKVLGIASPAKAFIEIIKWCFKGILEGIKEYGPKAIESIIDFFKQIPPLVMDILNALPPSIKEVVMRIPEAVKLALEKIFDIVKKLDFGNVFAAVLTVGIFKTVTKVTAVIDKLSTAILNVSSLFSGLGKMFESFGSALINFSNGWKKLTRGLEFKLMASGFRDIIISIGMLMAAIYLISKVNDKRSLWTAVAILAATSAVVIAIIKILTKTNIGKEGTKSILAFAAVLGSLVLTIYAVTNMITKLSKAAISLSKIDTKSLKKGILAVGILSGIVVGLIAAVMTFSNGNDMKLKGVAATILTVGLTMALMAHVAKSIGETDPWTLIKGVTVVSIFGDIIAELILSIGLTTKKGRTNIKGIATTILSVGVAMVLMAHVAKTIGKMDVASLSKGIIAIGIFAGIIVGLIAATKLAGKSKFCGTNILMISLAIGVLAFIGKQLSKMDVKTFEKGVAMIAQYALIISGLIAATKLAGNDAKFVGVNIFLISGAIALLAGVSVLLGMVDTKQLEKGILAVAVLSGVIDGLMLCCGKVDPYCLKTLIAITAIVVVLAGITVALSFIDESSLKTSAASLAILIGVFALLVKACENLGYDRFYKEALKNIAVLIGIVLALTGVIVILSKIPKSEGLIEKATALAILMTAMSWCLVPLAACQKNMQQIGGWNGAKQLLVDMTALVVACLAFVGILAIMQYIDNAKENVNVLTQLMVAMSLCLIPIAAAGLLMSLGGGMGAAAAVKAMIGVVVACAVLIGELALLNKVQNAEANVKLLTTLMESMSEMLTKIAAVSVFAAIGVVAAQGLELVLTEFIALSEILGLLCEVPGFKKFLEFGADLLVAIAGKIGEAVGSFVDGAINAMTQSLPEIGERLTKFWEKAGDFFDGVCGLDKSSALAGVGVITGAILALCVADMINGITSLLSMGNGGFAALGIELGLFWSTASIFLSGVGNTIKPETTEAVKNLAEAILVLTAADLVNQVSSLLGGGVDFGKFGEQLGQFGDGIKSFAISLNDPAVNPETLQKGAEAAKNLGEMASYIPSTGGLFQGLMGEKDMGQFGGQLSNFGGGLVMFARAVEGIGAYEEDVNKATEMGTALAKLNKSIPGAFGLVQGLLGEKSLANFGDEIRHFGGGLAAFANVVYDNSISSKVEDANAAVEIGTKLAELAEGLPNNGSKFKNFFCGKKESLATFGTNVENFGNGLKSYCDAIGNINIGAVNAGTNAAVSLANIAAMGSDIIGYFSKDADLYLKFKDGLFDFGIGIKGYAGAMHDIDFSTIYKSIDVGDKMGEMVNGLPKNGGIFSAFTGTSDLGTFSTNLTNFGTAIVSYANEVNGLEEGAVTKAKSAGDVILALADAVPKSGGIVDFFTGTSDLATISTDIPKFGEAINSFATQVCSISDGVVESGAAAGSALISMYKEIPKDGGLKEWISGGASDLTTMGSKLVDFSKSIKDFSVNACGVSTVSIQNGVSSGRSLFDFYRTLVKADISYFDSIPDMSKMTDIATIIKDFSSSTIGIDPLEVQNASESGKKIIDLAKYILTRDIAFDSIFNDADMVSFKSDLKIFGEAIADYANAVTGINTVDATGASVAAATILNAIGNIDNVSEIETIAAKLPEFGESLKSLTNAVTDLNYELLTENSSAILKMADNLNMAGSLGVERFIGAFKNSESEVTLTISEMLNKARTSITSQNTSFMTASRNLVTSFCNGIKSYKSMPTVDFSNLCVSCVDIITNAKTNFESAGKDLVRGFSLGITEQTFQAEATASAMAGAALTAAKEKLKEHSPSKASYKIGDYYVLGFINAIKDGTSKVYNYSGNMADTAKRGLSLALDKINELASSDSRMTISPVLDLSDISSGLNQIDGMFGKLSPTVGPSMALSGINEMMTVKSQNGINDDVVSAINKLGDNLNSTSGNSYTINGITYDDGSAISDAVKSLIQAARIERRR